MIIWLQEAIGCFIASTTTYNRAGFGIADIRERFHRDKHDICRFKHVAPSNCFQTFISSGKKVSKYPPLTYTYHRPPPGVDYRENKTVYGQILSGVLPCRVYQESPELLSFCTQLPKTKLHALVVPKRFVESLYSLTPAPDDVTMVQDMSQMGLEILAREQPDALAANDFILCYHIPPFSSVDHLHLFVLAPASELSFYYRFVKYNCNLKRLCISDVEVIDRLKAGKKAVPFKKMTAIDDLANAFGMSKEQLFQWV